MKTLKNLLKTETLNVNELMEIKGAAAPNPPGCEDKACSESACASNVCSSSSICQTNVCGGKACSDQEKTDSVFYRI